MNLNSLPYLKATGFTLKLTYAWSVVPEVKGATIQDSKVKLNFGFRIPNCI